jgi:hypothetical protein
MNAVNLKNLKMNDDVFASRRRVMGFVYEAKKLFPEMPRIEVRITEGQEVGENKVLLGMASLRVKHISITKDAIDRDNDKLRHVVFHELCHTLFMARHDEKCPLMCATVRKPATKEQCEQVFKKLHKAFYA